MPVVVETLTNQKVRSIACGAYHTLALTSQNDVYAWGSNRYGQCGAGNDFNGKVMHLPCRTNFENWSGSGKVEVVKVEAGGEHSGFIDKQGRLFTSGKNTKGQLGLGHSQDEPLPGLVTKLKYPVKEVSCGDNYTLILTDSGELHTTGDNSRGQLACGSVMLRNRLEPRLVEELSFTRLIKVRAGAFCAALSIEGRFFMWGEGVFGQLDAPKAINLPPKTEVEDIQVSSGGFAALITRSGLLYTWGANETG